MSRGLVVAASGRDRQFWDASVSGRRARSGLINWPEQSELDRGLNPWRPVRVRCGVALQSWNILDPVPNSGHRGVISTRKIAVAASADESWLDRQGRIYSAELYPLRDLVPILGKRKLTASAGGQAAFTAAPGFLQHIEDFEQTARGAITLKAERIEQGRSENPDRRVLGKQLRRCVSYTARGHCLCCAHAFDETRPRYLLLDSCKWHCR